ncbi:olfactory receptor 14J1-like, partial [Caloenas nicobarica]|uniref:olfactory receptor 14J1-like n=1 Tax=Caloenas nicobarica TaxID=187106 RepID=UPI0032B73FFF
LHYGTLLGSRACVHMAAAAWATGFLNALLHTANTFSLPLCKGNAVEQFFCEIPQILKLSCSQSYFREAGLILVSLCLSFGCFVFIVVSYVQILRAVLRIPSEQGRHKAFATCLPHLAVVSLFVITAMFAYLKPPSISSPSLDLVVSVLYSVVPPVVWWFGGLVKVVGGAWVIDPPPSPGDLVMKGKVATAGRSPLAHVVFSCEAKRKAGYQHCSSSGKVLQASSEGRSCMPTSSHEGATSDESFCPRQWHERLNGMLGNLGGGDGGECSNCRKIPVTMLSI